MRLTLAFGLASLPVVSSPHSLALEDLAIRCRQAGMKVTPQRLAVYAALLGTREHPSPEALFRTVREQMPTISLGTVYKTLDALQEAGLARPVALLNEAKRYDGNLSAHHHLICTACRRIEDYSHPKLDGLSPPKGIEGFVPAEVKVQILGLCQGCANEPSSKEKDNG